MVDEAVVETIRRFLASLSKLGINARRAVLFGSFARGRADQYSDMDVIVIAPEFDRPRTLELVKTLWKATVVDSRIEPIPCGELEWDTDESRPILEIARREGVTITA
jgi:predicted nucleotidyltransferase